MDNHIRKERGAYVKKHTKGRGTVHIETTVSQYGACCRIKLQSISNYNLFFYHDR